MGWESFKWNRRHFTNSFPSLSFPFPVSRELNKKQKKKKSLKQSSTLFLEGQGFDCKTSKSFQNTKYNNTRFVNVNQTRKLQITNCKIKIKTILFSSHLSKSPFSGN